MGWLGPAISATASHINSIYQSGEAARAATVANERQKELLTMEQNYNTEMWNKQTAWNEAMIDKQNEYNSPSSQMERLQAAGINPNLAFSNGAANTQTQVGNSASSGSPQAPSVAKADVYGLGDFSGFSNWNANAYQLQKEELKIKRIEAEALARKNNVDADAGEIRNQYLAKQLQVDIDNAIKSGQLTDAQRENLDAKTNECKTNTDLLNSKANQINWQVEKDKYFASQEYKNLQATEKEIAARIVDMYASASYKRSQIAVNGVTIDLYKSQNNRLDWELDFDKENKQVDVWFNRVNDTLGTIGGVFGNVAKFFMPSMTLSKHD